MAVIKVWVTDFKRKFLQLQWVDPATGKYRTKSSGCTRRRDAERAAAKLEEELNANIYGADGSIPWTVWRDQLITDCIGGLAASTKSQVEGILNRVEESISPATLADLNASGLSRHAAWMRGQGRAEDTIKSHLRHLRALLAWSADQGLIAAIPAVPKIRRARKGKDMKGRPITAAEFRQMLNAVPLVVGEARTPSWNRLLVGLWLSGLRLNEALSLSWTKGDNISVVVTSSGRCRLIIPGEHQKSREDQLFPLTPKFSAWLLKTPESDRKGWVFNPQAVSGGRQNNKFDVGRLISQIGKHADIVVDETFRPDGTSRKKYGSAHDLRRAFGTRLSSKVMPPILQKLMRHSHISTTMKYYVGLEVEETERVLYKKNVTRRHNTKHNTGSDDQQKTQ